MANYFSLTLDTTAPANPSIVLEGGATYATQQLITATIATSDTPTTGYQMKIWGDVDTSYDANVQDTEAKSVWITFNTNKQIKLLAGDASKTVSLKIRDAVYNESSIVSDTIILDMSLPTVTITGPDVSIIGIVAGKDTSTFSFTSDQAFVEYKVKVVNTQGVDNTSGTTIGIANGSTNMSGTAGNYAAATPINCQIKGKDLQAASSGDATKTIKVFVKDVAGNWSV